MAVGAELSSPAVFGKGQTAGSTQAEQRELFLDIFGGEVLTAFDLQTLTMDKITVRHLGGGMRSARFPKTWMSTAEYHVRGQELLGNDFETGEISISPDVPLVAHHAIYDLDDMLSHFDIRGPISSAMGHALAKVYDKNNFRTIIRAARTAAQGSFPGGNVITDAGLAATSGVYDGEAWIDAIRAANKALFNKDVPDDLPRMMAVSYDIFDALKYAKDANGQYLVINRDLNGMPNTAGIQGREETLTIDGVTIYKTRNKPNTDESADTSVFAKYRDDYSTTEAVLWTPLSVANVKMRDITFETTRDTRRQEDFMVASMLTGSDPLRPETAVEFKTA